MTARGSSASFDCRSGAVARGSSRGSALGGAEAGAAAAAGVVGLIAAAGRVSVAGALDVGGAFTCTNSDAGGPATVGAGLTADGRRNSGTRAHAAVAVSNPTTRRTSMIRSVLIEIMVGISIRFAARLPTVTQSMCNLGAPGRGLEARSICYPPTASRDQYRPY